MTATSNSTRSRAFWRGLRNHAKSALALMVLTALVGCTEPLRPFPHREPMWQDDDQQHVEARPESYFSPFNWDGADQMFFGPFVRFWKVDPAGVSTNVNAFDEVPNSSWWTNRLRLVQDEFTVEDAHRGACPEDPDNRIDYSGPWMVIAAKPNGANPGFIIRAADGRRYLIKMDGHLQRERATVADVFGSRLYHAIGYHAPCNFIVFFDQDQFEIDPEATTEDVFGDDQPLDEADVLRVLDAATVLPDGTMRASASMFLDGRPIGPWRYQETRDDDPNDVIRHDDRRELRGGRLLAAWLNHFDTREQNTLAVWMDDDGLNYVRHYYIDFGDDFGSRWPWDMLTRRLGHSGYFDPGHILADFLTLGAISRPWNNVEFNEYAPPFDYYDVGSFVPEDWVPGYPNPAFSRMQPEDGAWMARNLAYVTDELVRAMLDETYMSNPEHEAYLYRTLLGRRDRILADYLPIRSPIDQIELDGGELCFTDLAVRTDVFDVSTVQYETRVYFGDFEEPVWSRRETLADRALSDRVCLSLGGEPRPAHTAGNAEADSLDRYMIVDLIIHPANGEQPTPPARLHFYDQGEAGFDLVGIERPDSDDAPR